MGTRRLKEIVNGLMDNGKDERTPIAIIQNATLNSQKIIISDLTSILGKISHHETITPSVIIIGEVVNNYFKIQECLKNIPSNMVQPLGDLGFDIWKTHGIDA